MRLSRCALLLQCTALTSEFPCVMWQLHSPPETSVAPRE